MNNTHALTAVWFSLSRLYFHESYANQTSDHLVMKGKVKIICTIVIQFCLRLESGRKNREKKIIPHHVMWS